MQHFVEAHYLLIFYVSVFGLEGKKAIFLTHSSSIL